MGAPLQILLVNLGPEELGPVWQRLEERGRKIGCRQVVDLGELSAVLESGGCDLVVCGGEVPGLGVAEVVGALELWKDGVPLLLLDRGLRDDQAVEWLERGVWDIVPVGNLLRLAPAIERCLRDAGERRSRRQAQAALRLGEQQRTAVFDSTPASLAVLDQQGVIVAVNAAWEQSAAEYSGPDGAPPRNCGVGANYLEVCRPVPGRSDEGADAALEGIRAVLDGELPRFSLEYPCHSATADRWFQMTVVPLNGGGGGVVVSHLDITARKQVEERLQENEAQFRSLFEQGPDGTLVVEARTRRILFGNETMCRMLGYGPEDLAGADLNTLHLDADRPRIAAALDVLAVTSRNFGLSVPVRRKDGSVFLADISASQFRVGDQEWMVGLFRDVTERQRAEERSHIQHDLMLALAACTRLEEGLQRCIEAAIKVGGMDSGGFYLQDPATGALDLSVAQGFSTTFLAAAAHFEPTSLQARLVAMGQPIYSDFQALPLELTQAELREGLRATAVIPVVHEGRPIGCMNIASHSCREISPAAREGLETVAAGATQAIARLHAIEDLRRSEEKYRGIFDESVAAIYVFDADKRFVGANQAGLDLLGYSREELLRLRIADVDDDPVAVLPAHRQLLGGERLVNYEHRLRRKDGTVITVLNHSRPLTDAQGNVAGMQSTLTDISGRKTAERLQAMSLEVLRALNASHPTPEVIRRIFDIIRRETGVDAVGLRLREGDDFPYAVSAGFSASFLEAENRLTSRTPEGFVCRDEASQPQLDCFCGLVLSGRTDPGLPWFTPGGSAWTNDLQELSHLPEGVDPRINPHNGCLRDGYRSLALVPIRADGEILGLLQFNDRRSGCFTLEMVQFFEGLAASFGVALRRLEEEQALRENQSSLRSLFDAIPESLCLMTREGEILAANAGFTSRLRARADTCIGANLFDLLPEPLIEVRRAWVAEVVRTRCPVVHEEAWEGRHVRLSYCPVPGPDGQVECIVIQAADITERRRLEREREAALSKYQTLFNCLPLGITVTDPQGRIVESNAVAEEILGLSIAEQRERHVGGAEWAIVRLDGTPMPPAEFASVRALRDGRVVRDVEMGLVKSPTQTRWISVTAAPVSLPETGVVITYSDIGARMRAEAALRQNETRFRALIEKAPDGIALVDRQGVMTYASPAARRMFGVDVAGVLDVDPSASTHPEDLPGVLAGLEELLRNPALVKTLQYRFRHAEGHWRWIESTFTNLLALPGVDAIVINFRDIHDRKLAEEAQRESEDRYRRLVDGSPDAIGIFQENKLVFLNPMGLRSMRAQRPEQLLGKSSEQIIHPDDLVTAQARIRRRMAGDTSVYPAEVRYLRVDGTVVPVEVSSAPVQLAGKPAVQFIARDITERKEAEAARRASEQQLRDLALELEQRVKDRTAELSREVAVRQAREAEWRQAKEAADVANRAKSVFLANMSHEIRTPMNAVLGFTQLLLRDPEIGPAQHQRLTAIARSGEHLMNIINDILHMARIESGRQTLSPTAFDLPALLLNLDQTFRLRARAQRLAFAIEADSGLPRFLVADETKLRQVLLNLLGNAFKFTPRGGTVLVRVQATPTTPGQWRFQAEVEDTGSGIAPEEVARIFEPFYQTEAGRAAGGTGLGLSISRQFARLMGGDLTVRSQPGSGSCFTFHACVQIADRDAPLTPEPSGGLLGLDAASTGCRVLIADDNADNRDVLADLLISLGFAVATATNGLETIEQCEVCLPRLVLLDLRMPVLDGFETARRLRAAYGKTLAILVLSASVAVEVQQQALAAGADAFVGKPYQDADLLERIRVLTGVEFVSGTSAGPGEAAHEWPKPEALRRLPPALTRALRQALATADYDSVIALTAQVSAVDEDLGRQLRRLVERYDYENLESLVRSADGGG